MPIKCRKTDGKKVKHGREMTDFRIHSDILSVLRSVVIELKVKPFEPQDTGKDGRDIFRYASESAAGGGSGLAVGNVPDNST